MNTLRDLHEAFHELELRADAIQAAPEPAIRPGRSARRLIAPTASVAAVAAVALTVAGLTVWHDGSGSNSGTTPAGAGGGSQPQVLQSQPVAQTTTAPAGFQPPASADELAARARAILAGIATITVTDSGPNVQMTLPSGMKGAASAAVPNGGDANGAMITGTLTAAGRTGGFQLDVYTEKAHGTGTACDVPSSCKHHVGSDGSVLWASTWHDATGGLTEQVELDRADGGVISLHLSTERDPKGGGPAIASQLPLTVQQMTDLVSSDQW
jgi:hypothetical protein